jgi:transposase
MDPAVAALDLAKAGAIIASRSSPNFLASCRRRASARIAPADLLKLYLYGYLNRVRSSRRLEQEAERNLELIWLLGGLRPGYRTIANFRKENAAALKAANRDFVLIIRELGLVGGVAVAIDGAFFHGDASKASILTRKRLAAEKAALDRARLRQGARRVEPDGALLQPHPRAQHRRPRRPCRLSRQAGWDGGPVPANRRSRPPTLRLGLPGCPLGENPPKTRRAPRRSRRVRRYSCPASMLVTQDPYQKSRCQ